MATQMVTLMSMETATTIPKEILKEIPTTMATATTTPMEIQTVTPM